MERIIDSPVSHYANNCWVIAEFLIAVNYIVFLHLGIKLAFEIVAGVSTAAAGAQMTGIATGRYILLLGLLGGVVRSMVVDMLPPLFLLLLGAAVSVATPLPEVWTLGIAGVICGLILFLYPLIVTVVVASAAGLEYPFKPVCYGALAAGGIAIAGSLIGSSIGIAYYMELRKHHKTLWISYIWARGFVEFGGIVGEVFVGFLLVYVAKIWGMYLNTSQLQYVVRSLTNVDYTMFEPKYAAAMGAVYGAVMYGKMMVAMILSEVVEESGVMGRIYRDEV